MFLVPGLTQTITIRDNNEDDWDVNENHPVEHVLGQARIFKAESGTSHINNHVDYNQSGAYVLVQNESFPFRKGQYLTDQFGGEWTIIMILQQPDVQGHNYLYTRLNLRRIT